MNLVVGLIMINAGQGWSKASLSDNGYENVLVTISPEVGEDVDIVDKIKELLTRTSEELYLATRERIFLRSVKILLPQSWKMEADQAVYETIEDSEFIINNANPAYGDNPYTIQNGECGDPGDYTHITPWFVKNHDGNATSVFGRTDKIMVHEWAKLRWGIYEEYGYPGDEKFPMFYYKTTWGPNGQEDVLAPNFCTSIQVSGVSQDITTGGNCFVDSVSGLPDANCYFIPDLDNPVQSSYMALPYLEGVTDFCDDESEQFLHHPEIPTKQNLFCSGRSSWTVIMENEDFVNGANLPVEVLETTPQFVIIKPQNTKYVLVMDVSYSMLPDQIPPYNDQPDRAGNMKDAAKRWIKYEVADNTEVSLVVFSDVIPSYDPVIYHMNKVNDDTREEMIKAVNAMKFFGKTCIGCGLDRALNWYGGLKGTKGGVIILITDGEQLCSVPETDPTCLTMEDMIPQLISREVRVVTVALGLEADRGLEELALKTGGKSYFIDDSSGSGNINDAFSGSLTYQPGDLLGNTNIVVYQKDFTDVRVGDKLTGFYDIDASIGREVTFQVQVKVRDNECKESLEILIVSPDDDQSITTRFQCSAEDFGVFRHPIPDLAQVGRWIYMLTSLEDLESVSVKVESKSRKENSDPILTQCWIATGSQEINTEVDVMLSVVAKVTQGTKPVIGAKVLAEIERPATADGTPQPPMELELVDNGNGADKIRNDGTYSRYFAKFTGSGRYSVKCQVQGDDHTGVNGGFTGSKVYPQIHNPHNPLCCGSNALAPGAQVDKTGNFTRQASGGSFQVTNDVDPDIDNIPPGQVTDLKITQIYDKILELTLTAPGDDLDSNDKTEEYIFKYSSTAGNLTDKNFDDDLFNIRLSSGNTLGSNLLPVIGGTIKSIYINSEIFQKDKKYVMAMRAIDEAGNEGSVSNPAEIYLNTKMPTTSPPTETTPGTPDSCQPGWIPGPGGCFAFFLYKSFNWFDARAGCDAVDAWLAEPRTEETSTFLTEYVLQQEQNTGVHSWWIGLTDHFHDTQWKWEHGQEDLTFTNWAPGYPTVNSEDCVMLDFNVNSLFRWSNADCGNRFASPICQKLN